MMDGEHSARNGRGAMEGRKIARVDMGAFYGDGYITVIAQPNANQYRAIAQFKTEPGGRTSFWAPQLDRLYLGVWGRGGRPEELRVYAAEP